MKRLRLTDLDKITEPKKKGEREKKSSTFQLLVEYSNTFQSFTRLREKEKRGEGKK